MKNFFQNKKVLVAGGTGMVGQKLVPKLINLGAEVYVASLDDDSLVENKVKKTDEEVDEHARPLTTVEIMKIMTL